LAMLRLGVGDIPQFKVTTLEIDRKGSSYTIDTIKALHKDHLRLLLSEESAEHLPSWKETKELITLAPPLIGSRFMQISSTMIRERLKKKLYCGHLVPAKTLEYIFTH